MLSPCISKQRNCNSFFFFLLFIKEQNIKCHWDCRQHCGGAFFFFLKRALHSHKIPTFYLIKSQSRLYFYYHYRQWLIRILLYESFGVLVPLFFQVFVIPCVSGGMPVDDSVSLPRGFRGTTRSGDCLHVCPLATLKQMNRRKKEKKKRRCASDTHCRETL